MDKQEMLELAAFGKLRLTDPEAEEMERYLRFALDALDHMSEIVTDQTVPMIHSVELSNVFREDIARQAIPRERILANAPEQEDGCFRVPMVLD